VSEAGDLLGLAGRVALVAGGAGGIGRATVALLARAGARVVSADLAAPPAGADGVDGAEESLACDVTDAAAVRDLVAGVAARHGRLDVLVHSAGITRDAVLWKLADRDWSEVLRVNLDSAFLLLREAAPVMRRQGGGAVVLVTSINGERGKLGQANYAASKAGLIGLGRSAARELGRFGVRVNLVAPGLVLTPMTRALAPEVLERAVGETVLGRLAEPDDVARAVLFLASAMAGHVTGQVLRVDGGQLIA
jgi:NAD(P)-dependent dehydrogenase (short-subunit alcohol dehydrogenase family)